MSELGKCSIKGTIRTGGPCTADAVVLNTIGHPVCQECADEFNYLVGKFNELRNRCDQNDPLLPAPMTYIPEPL